VEDQSGPRSPFARLFAGFLVVALLLGLVTVLAVRNLASRIPNSEDIKEALAPEPFQNVGPTVIRSIRELAQLTTFEFVEYTVIEKGTDSGVLAWARGDSLTLLAVARIGAGVDLSGLSSESFIVNDVTGEVTVDLPAAEIQYVAVDNDATQVIDRTTGLFTKGDPRLETDARRVAEEVLVGKALETGILEQAADNAAKVITNFLLSLGYTDVVVRTTTAPAADA
jgi:hypothetical protein